MINNRSVSKQSMARTHIWYLLVTVVAMVLTVGALDGCARSANTPATASPTVQKVALAAPSATAVATATAVPTATVIPTVAVATATPTSTPTLTPTATATVTPSPTVTSTPLGKVAAIGVMIDNDPHARPQTGLNAADVVYEIDAEFNLTRFLAIYFANAPPVVGSIRSTRPYFAMAMTEYGGGLVHCLDVPGVTKVLSSGFVYNYDLCQGYGDEGAMRVSYRQAPFNLYVNAHLLQSELRLRPPRPAVALLPRQPLSSSASATSGVSITYPLGHTVDWTWNGHDYQRQQDGAPHLDSNGNVVTTNVIVVQRAVTLPTTYFGDAGYHIVHLIGSGNALILANGVSLPVHWSRASESQPTIFTDLHGNRVALPPGRVFFEVVPTNATVNLSHS